MSGDDPASGALRVDSLLELRRYDDARAMARELLARNPSDLRLLEQIVVASIELRDHRAALEDARRLLAAAPETARAHELMAVALHNRRRLRQSVTEARRAVALEPNDPAYRLRLSEMLLEFAQSGETVVHRASLRREAARQAFVARQLAPGSADPYIALARAGLAMGDRDGAREAVEQALVIDPQEHRAHQVLGEIEFAGRRISKAGRHFMDAGRLDPQDPNTMALLRRASGGWLVAGAAVISFPVIMQAWRAGYVVAGLIAALVLIACAAIVSRVMTARLPPEAREALKRDKALRRRR